MPRKKPTPQITENIELPANGWKPRHYQVPFWEYMMKTPWSARAILCHHRRAGKDHTATNWAAVASQMRVGTYVHILPYANQGRRIIWEGVDFNGRPFLSAFPDQLIARKSDQEMRLTLTNGSRYQVIGSDDPDKLVGINCIGAIFSEYALQDPKAYKLVMPILKENGGWAIFPTTPRGKNHFHKLIHGDPETGQTGAINDPKWFVSIETIHTTGAVSEEEVEQCRREGMEEPLIQQEFFCSFEVGLQGAYYERQITALREAGHIGHVPYDPALEVGTAWDLGINDCTSVWFFQEARDGIRIIDFYEGQDQPLAHYIKHLRDKANRHNWVYGKHFGPHDIMQRDLSTGNTLYRTAQQMGLRWTVVEKANDLMDGIEAVRQLLPTCRFNAKSTEKGITHLNGYRKQWDEKNKVYRNAPLHDLHSHAADSFRTLAMGLRQYRGGRKKPNNFDRTDNAYDPFAY